MAKKKRAFRQIRRVNGKAQVVFIDVDTGLVVTNLAGYEIITQHSLDPPAVEPGSGSGGTTDTPARPTDGPSPLPTNASKSEGFDAQKFLKDRGSVGQFGMDDVVDGLGIRDDLANIQSKGDEIFGGLKSFLITTFANTPLGQKMMGEAGAAAVADAAPGIAAGAQEVAGNVADTVTAGVGAIGDFFTGGQDDTTDVAGMGGTDPNAVDAIDDVAPVQTVSNIPGLSAYTLEMGPQRPNPPKQSLLDAIQVGVTSVYGPDYTIKVLSGEENEGDQAGAERHPDGIAADIKVFDPSGKQLPESEYQALAQYWLTEQIGSVGFPDEDNIEEGKRRIHLDLVGGIYPDGRPLQSDEGLLWFYGGQEAKAKYPEVTKARENPEGNLPPLFMNPNDARELQKQGITPPIDPAVDAQTLQNIDIGIPSGLVDAVNKIRETVGQESVVAPGANAPYTSANWKQMEQFNNPERDVRPYENEINPETGEPYVPRTAVDAIDAVDQTQQVLGDTNQVSSPDTTNQQPTTPDDSLIGSYQGDTTAPLTTEPITQPVPEQVIENKGFSQGPIDVTTPNINEMSTMNHVQRSYLNLINEAEGSPRYNQAFNYEEFNDFSGHPEIYNREFNTYAAGAFQITKTTWDEYAPQVNANDFTLPNQERVAWKIAEVNHKRVTGRNLYDDLASGDPALIASAITTQENRWESLPGGKRPKFDITTAITKFTDYLKQPEVNNSNLGLRGETGLGIEDLGRPFGNTDFESKVGTTPFKKTGFSKEKIGYDTIRAKAMRENPELRKINNDRSTTNSDKGIPYSGPNNQSTMRGSDGTGFSNTRPNKINADTTPNRTNPQSAPATRTSNPDKNTNTGFSKTTQTIAPNTTKLNSTKDKDKDKNKSKSSWWG